MAMIGMALTFNKRINSGTFDDFGNPVETTQTFTVDDCLIAPITEPIDRVESSALDRDVTVVRIHLPKADDADVSDCAVAYAGRTFRVIGRPVEFMAENTPTRWNRYVRAEEVNG